MATVSSSEILDGLGVEPPFASARSGEHQSDTRNDPLGPSESASRHHQEDAADDDTFEVSREGVIGTCFDTAQRIASGLNHCELTFEHLLLAMTQIEDAREKLREWPNIDLSAARRAAVMALADIGEGRSEPLPESDEMRSIMRRAEQFAHARGREHQSGQKISVKDVLDAVSVLPVENSPQRLLFGRVPTTMEDQVIQRIDDMQARFDALSRQYLPIIDNINQRDMMAVDCLMKLTPIIEGVQISLSAHAAPQWPPSDVADEPVRPSALLSGPIVGVIAVMMLAVGYALGSAGMGPKIMSWLGRFIV